MTARDLILIDAPGLRDRLRLERHLPVDAPRTRVLDVRWTLPQPDGRPHFEAGHIPTAVYVDLEHELSGHGRPQDGRHPLPARADLEAAARRWGIRNGDMVVVVDGGGNLAAARAWWLLKNAGLERVRLLDGALPAWERAGYELEAGPTEPLQGDVTLAEDRMPVLPFANVAAFVADGGVLLDARAGERYRGEQEPIDPRAGHIPGALSSPTTENLDETGSFLSAAELRQRFASLGVNAGRPAATYCGSGVTAAHQLVALALAGVDAALYPGSWSQWSNHPELPVETGAVPDHTG
ncbi:sulfurtransferase [Leucobacter sp. GX24907]